ncbi:CPBP family intramembrane glutamic endopeptidase [Massilia endophytica]|uniref:CPBP family intramembrane glutamic endopeptidase n=1 Tax=Massilia endophytica TaxID=2899220 RepID=UPI001E5AF828|nr:type II CAAX endopeptidase family protein [Massilia endophytica]UGQ47416.1 CPBP family intramembrane metalloprotease [Massilia endophytica]
MLTNDLPAPSQPKLWLAFIVLFCAYQLPEGLGGRILGSFAVQAGLLVAFLPIAWAVGRWLGFRGLDAWYLDFRRGWFLLLAAPFALAVLAKAGALALGEMAGIYGIAIPKETSLAQVLPIALGMLPYTFLPSIAEDIVTRGFLMRALPAVSRQRVFIALSALLFVLNHIYRLGNGPLEWLLLFCFGLAYAAALFYSRSLWAAVGLHWGWNYAGQLGDRLANIDALNPAVAPLVSSATHLLMLGAVVLCAGLLRAKSFSLRPAP